MCAHEIAERRHLMAEKIDDDDDERLEFWGTWKRLYIFIIIYGILQIVVLYFFTRAFNHS
jgi:hypothetical protein